jgi:hypothetical protein
LPWSSRLRPSPPAAELQAEDALKAIANVLNAVERHYCDSETGYDLGGPLGGANSLLYFIDYGLRAQDAIQKRSEEGKSLPDDFTARDL